MGLPVRVETRTGDTPQSRRARQRERPPDILLTTPESLALLLSYPDAAQFFASLRCVIIDELHAFADQQARRSAGALPGARWRRWRRRCRFVGLSATVADPPALARLSCAAHGRGRDRAGRARRAAGRRDHRLPRSALPWAGHMGHHAVPEVYDIIRQHKTSLVFVNTRAQAELVFHAVALNEENLPIGLHHGSLAVEQRRKVEAAMAAGKLRAVVATSSLDLGIDWGDVDLVIQMGAPKGVSRLLQRIGRANHRLDEPSRAMIVPANRFEVLECSAALEAVEARELDGDPPRPACLDVLAQHIVGAAPAPSRSTATRSTTRCDARSPIATCRARTSTTRFDFVATGGYALAAYDRWHRLKQLPRRPLAAARRRWWRGSSA